MTSSALSILVLAALLVCWAVGAHNRLVRLRRKVEAEFLTLQAHLMIRQGLLRHGLDLLGSVQGLENSQPQALAQNVQVLQDALEALARRTLERDELERLQQAEQALAQQMAQLGKQAAALPAGQSAQAFSRWAGDLMDWQDRLVFLLGPYQDAVRTYNDAVREFPALLMARASGFTALPQFEGLGAGAALLSLRAPGQSSPGPSDL